MKIKPIITFCTSNMGFTHYLEQTYLKNLELGEEYSCKFVLVNYNSKDNMEEWVKENISCYIDSKVVNFISTNKPQYWHMSAAKNFSHKFAKTEVVCNLDSDNLLTKEYLEWLINICTNHKDFVTHGSWHGGGGRIATRKEIFDRMGGYDEQFGDYGLDDIDFIDRARRFQIPIIKTPNGLIKYIDNSWDERVKNLSSSIKKSLQKSKERRIYNKSNYIIQVNT